MKKLIFAVLVALFSNTAFSQSIEGKWLPEGFTNTMYLFEDGLRWTTYCVEGNCDSTYLAYQAGDSTGIPGAHSYTYENDTLTIDLNFGNYAVDELSFKCEGNLVELSSSQSYLTKLGTDPSTCLQTDSCIANPIEGCMAIEIWDPVCGCDGVTYSNSAVAACSSILSTTPGECSSIEPFSCTSSSGIEITEVGSWVNPNDPCDTGECSSDGQFYEIVIDCMEQTGLPCDGEWVEVEGQCCSECQVSVGINELETKEPKLLKMIDIVGREYNTHPNGQLLFYIYDSGKIEKRIK
jgi:hypothetical protein